jgi:hypothetical protein
MKRQERVLLRKIKEAEKADNQELLHELLGEKQRRLHGRLNSESERIPRSLPRG